MALLSGHVFLDFGTDLREYYAALRDLGCAPPSGFRKADEAYPTDGDKEQWSRLDVAWLSRYDFSNATARLIASVPGMASGRHKAAAMHKWGHMKLRAILRAEPQCSKFEGAPLVMQVLVAVKKRHFKRKLWTIMFSWYSVTGPLGQLCL